jgi:hypothetical protein
LLIVSSIIDRGDGRIWLHCLQRTDFRLNPVGSGQSSKRRSPPRGGDARAFALSKPRSGDRVLNSNRASLDAVGMSCAAAEYSGGSTRADTFTYLIAPQPSVQHIMDPDGDQRAGDVLILALRTRTRLG